MSDIRNILDNLHEIEKQNKAGNLLERIMRSITVKKKTQAMVHPCLIDGRHTLVYENGLELRNPTAFEQISRFASAQGYQLKEDRRSDFLEGIKRVKNRRRANVISVMMLTAGLMSQTAQAKSHAPDDFSSMVNSDTTQTHVEAGFDFDFDSIIPRMSLCQGY